MDSELELIECPHPDCTAPFEIRGRWTGQSTDGPIPMISGSCINDHVFNMPETLAGRRTLASMGPFMVDRMEGGGFVVRRFGVPVGRFRRGRVEDPQHVAERFAEFMNETYRRGRERG